MGRDHPDRQQMATKSTLKNNDWILLTDGTTQATWYRVVGAGYDGGTRTSH